MSIAEEIQSVRNEMDEAALKSGRKPEEISLLLVSKYVEVEKIQEAYDAGMRSFGENRVQELQSKIKELPDDIAWHFIGGLQTNKVKHIVGETTLIHSLDRDDLAEELLKQAARVDVPAVDCLLQVNSTGEKSKGGLEPADVMAFMDTWAHKVPLQIRGLMTMGPLRGTEQEVRAAFAKTRELFEKIKAQFPECQIDTLSMGMSGDFNWAIEEGSTLVRLGTRIFGSRKPA